MSLIIISVGEWLGLLTQNSYYDRIPQSNHQVQFLMYDELGAIKQTKQPVAPYEKIFKVDLKCFTA